MSTYDHKKVLSDYVNGRMTVEMAMGHSLQHIDKLYESQAAANLSRYGLRDKVDSLEKTVTALQTESKTLRAEVDKLQTAVDRLTTLIKTKPPPKRKRNAPHKQ